MGANGIFNNNTLSRFKKGNRDGFLELTVPEICFVVQMKLVIQKGQRTFETAKAARAKLGV